MDNRPIGVFDSGIGGLSIWEALKELMPSESIIYFGDIKNCPYGYKSKEEVQKLSFDIVKFLIEKDCKLIVIACNTATSAAIELLRANFDIPMVGIEPAIKPAAELTKTGNVGVLATEGTLKSEMFNDTSSKFASHINIIIHIGDGLVGLVEKGDLSSEKAKELIKKCIDPLLKENVDQIVLGCTHYPFLIPLINKITENKVNIINPAPAVARQTKNILAKRMLEANPNNHPFYRFNTYKDSKPYKELINSVLLKLGIDISWDIEEINSGN